MLLITHELNKILHNAHTKLHLRNEPTAVEELTIIKHQFCSWGLLIMLPVNVLMYCFGLHWLLNLAKSLFMNEKQSPLFR